MRCSIVDAFGRDSELSAQRSGPASAHEEKNPWAVWQFEIGRQTIGEPIGLGGNRETHLVRIRHSDATVLEEVTKVVCSIRNSVQHYPIDIVGVQSVEVRGSTSIKSTWLILPGFAI